MFDTFGVFSQRRGRWFGLDLRKRLEIDKSHEDAHRCDTMRIAIPRGEKGRNKKDAKHVRMFADGIVALHNGLFVSRSPYKNNHIDCATATMCEQAKCFEKIKIKTKTRYFSMLRLCNLFSEFYF